jgi:hypothetical protein
MTFRFFKKISPTVSKYLPADCESYKNKKDYNYDTRIGASKKMGRAIMVWIGTFFMRDMASYEERIGEVSWRLLLTLRCCK